MPRPPVDDDLLHDVLDQVVQALGDVDAHADPDLLLGGIRDALESIADDADGAQVQVTVLDGGWSPEPRPPKGRTHLRLADEDDLPDPEDDELEASEHGRLRVQVMEPRPRDTLTHGVITLGPSATQVLLCAPREHLYRVRCERGTMAVEADGEEIALGPGQTTDVEAKRLVVRAGPERGAAGKYHPVR